MNATITIEVEIEQWYELLVASIRRIKRDDGTIDEQALQDFEDFIVEVENLLLYYDFDLVEDHRSNYSKISRYYYFYPRKKDTNKINEKYLIFFRISDHELITDKDTKAYYNRIAQKYSRQESNKIQRYKIRSIIVNEDRYYNYDDALDAVERIIENLSE